MEKVSKNIAKGEPISDLRDMVRLAEENKSVVVEGAWGCYVRPAAFMINWSLGQLSRMKFYYSIKL